MLLRGSRCPSGCRYDRSSAGGTRFLREDGDEQVLFEEVGPGAITRIWMTTGWGYSEDLDPSIRIRIRLDGESAPRVDLPLPVLFSGAFVDGVLAGRFPPVDANPFRRFREQEIELALDALPKIRSTLEVEIVPRPMAGEAFTEIRWEIAAGPPAPLDQGLPLSASR